MAAGSKVVHSDTGTKSGALAALLFVSGVLALVYEIAWQRQFSLVLGSAAAATSAVLAAYFGGLGVGSWWVGRRAATYRRPLRVYALLEVLVGLGAILVGPLLQVVEGRLRDVNAIWGDTGSTMAWVVRFGLVAATIALPTFCMGGTVPLLGALADAGRLRLGISAGLLYVVNTAGAALGAVSVPFLLFPTFGLHGMVVAAAILNFALAGVAWWLDARAPREVRTPAGFAEATGTAATETNKACLIVSSPWLPPECC